MNFFRNEHMVKMQVLLNSKISQFKKGFLYSKVDSLPDLIAFVPFPQNNVEKKRR